MKCEDCKYVSCEDCKYVSYDEATGIFDCHHYAPRPVAELPREGCPMGSDFTRTLWPIVNPEDWCGEFEGKEERDKGKALGIE